MRWFFMDRLGVGAEAKLYASKIFGIDVVVKVREPKKYRIKELDESIRKTRTRNEAKILAKLGKSGISVPALMAVGQYSIYMERLNGVLLKDLKSDSSQNKIFSELGSMLAKMHVLDVAHGDFTPANVMLCKNKLFLIDFGLSESTNSVEEKALDILLIKRSLKKAHYTLLLKSYMADYKDSKTTLNRLEKIELRGRYQTRTLA